MIIRLLTAFSVLPFSFLCFFLQAQTPRMFEWTYRGFIENRGQFDGRLGNHPAKILFGVDHGSLQIYFTDRGVSYAFYSTRKNYLRKKGQKEVPRMIVDHEMIHFTLEGMSLDGRWEGRKQRNDLHTYPSDNSKNHGYLEGILAYEKLVYTNIYPNIDLEYSFHPKGGLKYAFIVHPEGNPDDIRISVTNNNGLTTDEKGNLLIKTVFGTITDHQPHTFYKNLPEKSIPSKFVIQENTFHFQVSDYDKGKTIIVDPWTLTPNAFSNSNKIWEIETDQNGNIYVYGGDSPLRLRKYNAAGNLQWTYNTPWDTANYWVGTLKTDLAGNSYITTGTSGTVRKINTSGTLSWTSANNGPVPEIEFWSLSFNCDYTKLYCGGMRAANGINVGSYRGVLFELSLANGAISGFKEVGFATGGFPPTIKEVRSIAASPNQNIYYLTLDSVGGLTSGFNTLFQIPSGFNFSYGIPNYGVTNQGIHAVAANADFLYTMNGNSVQRRNINSGTILNSAAVPGGINNTVPLVGGNTPGNSGLVIDTCGNVYVGSANAVHKFSPSLNLLATYNTPAAVYDVALNYNGEVVACGNNFITSINTLSPCPPPPAVCLNCIQIIPVPPLCGDAAPITLSVNQTGGTWSGPGITNAVAGTFSPASAGPGTHIIYYSVVPAPTCGADSMLITVNNCAPPAVCINDNGNLVASGGAGGPYTWQQETTQQDCSACLFGCVLPPGCAQNVTAWSGFATGNSVSPPAAFPIRLVDANGNFIQINNLSELLPCADCPGLAVTVVSSTNPTCAGQNNGTASINVSGGTPPYTYTWLPGNLSGSSQNNLAPGNYVVTVTDAENCSGSVNFSISAPPPINISLGNTTPADCNVANGAATVAVSGGTGPLGVLWNLNPPQNSLSVFNLSAGTYLVTATDSTGCSDSLSVNIGVVVSDSSLSVIPEVTQESCLGNDGSILLSVSAGVPPYSFLWSNNTAPDTSFAQGLTAGGYTVTVSDLCYSLVLEIILEENVSIPSKDLPNIVTPNGDGINDLLDLEDQFEFTTGFNASIMNRWGVPLYSSENKSILWNAENVSDGVYFLVITYTDCTGKQEKLNGTVTVSR